MNRMRGRGFQTMTPPEPAGASAAMRVMVLYGSSPPERAAAELSAEIHAAEKLINYRSKKR